MAAILAAVTAAVVPPLPTASAIANGEDVADGEYPFSVSLSMPEITRPDGSTYASACSGALLSKRWIISAGHCFHDGARNRVSGPPRYPVTATIGQATLSGTEGYKLEVVRVVQHQHVDVAIAELAAEVPGIAPARPAWHRPDQGEVVRLVGWGSADGTADLEHRPDRMQTGQFTVTGVDNHHVYLTGYRPEPTTSACPYDSGAPYFRELPGGHFELIATEVTGPSCPHGEAETAARIDVLKGWLWSHIRS